METELTKSEQSELARLCKVVDEGLSSFLAVGTALVEINEGRLYRQNHETFEAFVKERWGISRQRAYQLMEAAEIKSEMSTSGLHQEIADEITSERQLRELSRVGTEALPDVVERVAEKCKSEGVKPTAKVIRSVVDEAIGKPEPKPVKPEPVRSKTDEFELRCRHILEKHAKGMRLQLSNLGYSDEFESFLNRIDEIVENG